MTPTPVNSDKFVFQELQSMVNQDKQFAWFQSDSKIAVQIANGAENVGPRWSLWKQTAANRIPIYRYRHNVGTAAAPLYQHAFQTTNDWQSAGFQIDNSGNPIGYATLARNASGDCLPVLQCSDGGTRFAYTQWANELAAYESNNGLTQTPTAWSSPMMCLVESVYDAANGQVALTSNDPDPTKAAAGEVNVYRGVGTAIRFFNMGAGEFPQSGGISVTYASGPNQGQSAIGAGKPFLPVTTSFPNSQWIIANDQQAAADVQFEYTVTVLVEGQPFAHDPKIIQRKQQFVD